MKIPPLPNILLGAIGILAAVLVMLFLLLMIVATASMLHQLVMGT